MQRNGEDANGAAYIENCKQFGVSMSVFSKSVVLSLQNPPICSAKNFIFIWLVFSGGWTTIFVLFLGWRDCKFGGHLTRRACLVLNKTMQTLA
jgi:hypothetical protein